MKPRHSLEGDAFGMSSTVTEDVDPMSSVANIADAMLVFACGLMVALVAFWNVGISPMTEEIEQDDLERVEDMDERADEMNAGGSGYTELGTVYQDPETGEMFLIIPSEEEGGASMSVPVEESSDETSVAR